MIKKKNEMKMVENEIKNLVMKGDNITGIV